MLEVITQHCQRCPEVMYYHLELINDCGTISKHNVTGGVKQH